MGNGNLNPKTRALQLNLEGLFKLLGGTAEERLRFLAAVARLWRTAARPDIWDRTDSTAMSAVGEWLRMARGNLGLLRALIERVHQIAVPESTTGLEGVMEFDRRRAVVPPIGARLTPFVEHVDPRVGKMMLHERRVVIPPAMLVERDVTRAAALGGLLIE